MSTFLCLCSGVANDFVLLGDVLRQHGSFIFRDRIFNWKFQVLNRRPPCYFAAPRSRRTKTSNWLLWKHKTSQNPKVCPRIRNILPFFPILKQINPVHTTPSYSLPQFRPPSCLFFFKYSDQNYAMPFYHLCSAYFVNLFFLPLITLICVTRRYHDIYL